MTKYDKLQLNAEIRTRREENLKTLNASLEEAQGVWSVLPSGNTMEALREREAVKQRINELNALIEDERKAIEALEYPDEASVSKILDNMVI